MIRALLPMFLSFFSLSCAQKSPRPDAPETDHIKVRTFNVNYGLAGDEATLDAIGDGSPDIVLLQETNEPWEAAIHNRFTDAYPYQEFHHCCGAGGTAVLSKYPIRDVRIVEPPKDGWFPSMIVVAETPIGRVQFLNVHLHPPVSDSGSFVSGYFSTRKTRAAEIKTVYAQRDLDLPTVVVGDFNESTSGRAINFLEGEGYASVPTNGSSYDPTWRWNTSVGTIRSQLDHIVVDDDFGVFDANVLPHGRSDHLPVDVILTRGKQ